MLQELRLGRALEQVRGIVGCLYYPWVGMSITWSWRGVKKKKNSEHHLQYSIYVPVLGVYQRDVVLTHKMNARI